MQKHGSMDDLERWVLRDYYPILAKHIHTERLVDVLVGEHILKRRRIFKKKWEKKTTPTIKLSRILDELPNVCSMRVFCSIISQNVFKNETDHKCHDIAKRIRNDCLLNPVLRIRKDKLPPDEFFDSYNDMAHELQVRVYDVSCTIFTLRNELREERQKALDENV